MKPHAIVPRTATATHAVHHGATPVHVPARTRVWREKVPRISQFVSEYLLVLPLGALIAMIWVNLRPESYYTFTYDIAFAVNDVAMVLFFGLIGKEVVEATAPGGVLHSWRRIIPPVIAAVGATIVPALLYVVFVRAVDEPMLEQAWAVSFATDVALAYVIARLIFPKHPAVPFVLLVALAADALGFVALAAVSATSAFEVAGGALLLVTAIGIAAVLRMRRVRSFWPYVLIAGTLSWLALYGAGFHTAFALLPILPFLPHAARDPGFFVDASPGARDALNRFELWARHPAQIALFFFGLVNAGVPFRGLEMGTWAVPMATVIGKPIGILGAVAIAVAAGLHLPPRIGWRDLIVIGLITAVGFTVALFFATGILATGQLLRETKMGVLLGLGAIGLAFAAARALRVGRFSAE